MRFLIAECDTKAVCGGSYTENLRIVYVSVLWIHRLVPVAVGMNLDDLCTPFSE